MTDWNGLFRSNEFRDYRRKQVEMIGELLNDKLSSLTVGRGEDPKYIKGQMDMLNHILRLPGDLTKDNETLDLLNLQLTEDIANLTKYLMRKAVNE
jgi:hypothetical protein